MVRLIGVTLTWTNRAPQVSQRYGFSPEWMREWVFRLAGRLNWAPHTLQWYGFSPVKEKCHSCICKYLSDRRVTGQSFTWWDGSGSWGGARIEIGHTVAFVFHGKLVLFWIRWRQFGEKAARWDWRNYDNKKNLYFKENRFLVFSFGSEHNGSLCVPSSCLWVDWFSEGGGPRGGARPEPS